MDKALFVSSHGAQSSMRELEVITNNLANLNTNGFRADASYVEPYQFENSQNNSRVYSKINNTYTDFQKGPILNTERDLDIAVNGDGFLAVQSKAGKEGYTRAGSLQLTSDGTLMTQTGHLVMGNAGVITIPPAEKISIGSDGTVSARLLGSDEYVAIDRIKLTKPEIANLEKGQDGLFYLKNEGTAPQDLNIKILTGALEGSNVNSIDAMTQLIDLSRHYEIHTNFMKTFAENSSKANQLLDITR